MATLTHTTIFEATGREAPATMTHPSKDTPMKTFDQSYESTQLIHGGV